jgi:hypothetical protein
MSPVYQTNPLNQHVEQANPGLPVFLLGTFSYITAPTIMQITNVALTSNVATLTVKVIEGNIPTTAQTIYVTCDNSIFNGDATTITGVTIDATTGIGTLTYAKTHANVASVAATGLAEAPVVATTDALANGSSVPASLQSNTGPNNGRSIRFDVTVPSLPTTATITAQSAVTNVDSDYQNLGTVASVTGGTLSGGSAIFTDIIANFVRFNITSVTGGSSPTITGKVTI